MSEKMMQNGCIEDIPGHFPGESQTLMTQEFLYSFIRQYKYGILSTVSFLNVPESACVGITITPELGIIFDTVSDSRKYKNL